MFYMHFTRIQRFQLNVFKHTFCIGQGLFQLCTEPCARISAVQDQSASTEDYTILQHCSGERCLEGKSLLQSQWWIQGDTTWHSHIWSQSKLHKWGQCWTAQYSGQLCSYHNPGYKDFHIRKLLLHYTSNSTWAYMTRNIHEEKKSMQGISVWVRALPIVPEASASP